MLVKNVHFFYFVHYNYMYYNISREIRRFDCFRASLFPRNSGITAKIDGMTRLPCYTTAAVTAKAVIYKLLSFNCFMFFP